MRSRRMWSVALFLLCGLSAAVQAAQVEVKFPLNRKVYQTNETISLAVVRQDANALAAGVLALQLTGADKSQLSFQLAVPAVAKAGADARRTELVSLNARLLRPGKYAMEIACDGAKANAEIEVYSHLRRSLYTNLHFATSASGAQQGQDGEEGIGFNLLYNQQPAAEDSIRGGVDVMGLTRMGGMHQHDGNLECDWSDPNVTIGAISRGMINTYAFRTWPNNTGSHVHDEPGLTWAKHPKTGEFGPHDIAEQRAAYKRAFDEEAVWHNEVDPKNTDSLARWTKMNDFKLGFMDAFWKASREDISRMKPGFLTVTQSQYGWIGLYDGYYFNVVRSMPVVSGHGGYNDFWLRNFNPSLFLEMALPRQLDKPTWYLPDWFVATDPGLRLETAMSFITGIQGIAIPPGMKPFDPPSEQATQAIVEWNRIQSQLGSIFARPDYTRQPLAILYSKSNAYYQKQLKQVWQLQIAYLASKMIQQPINVVLDEDIIDGGICANKAVILSGIEYLDPAVKAALETYIKGGGKVILTDECTVAVSGAVKLGVAAGVIGGLDKFNAELKAKTDSIQDPVKKGEESAKANSWQAQVERAAPVAKALRAKLKEFGVAPAFETEASDVAAGRQVRGDIEYLFAVNFRMAPELNVKSGGLGVPVVGEADLTFPANGRTAYDAVRGGPVSELAGGKTAGKFRFGPGGMRAIALTARPIGGVKVGAPSVRTDLTRTDAPIRLEIGASLLDDKGGLLAGAAPLRVRVTDSLGQVRYDLNRATFDGVCNLSLPLGVNDPAGDWTVTVTELLANTTSTAKFAYRPQSVGGSVAGTEHRAMVYGPDRENIYRFFRKHRQVIIAKGASDYNNAAAERLAAILKPYNVNATIVAAGEVKARELSAEEARTWCGHLIAGKAKPGRENPANVVGWDLPTATIVLGNGKDNPMIAYMQAEGGGGKGNCLPYLTGPDVPGRGHGMVAWQTQVLGHDVESITLYADDAAGMAEAVGTAFEIAIGFDPLTPYALPLASSLTPATVGAAVPELPVAWQAALPDRVLSLKAEGEGVAAVSMDGTACTIGKDGKPGAMKAGEPLAEVKPGVAEVKDFPADKLLPFRIPKLTAAGDGLKAVAHWGGWLQVFDGQGNEKARQRLPQDATSMVWSGGNLVVGLADGQVVALKAK